MNKLFPTLAIAAAVSITQPSFATDIDAMTDQERTIFGQEVRAYLLENPAVIVDALRILEQQQQVAEAQADTQLIANNLERIQNDGISWEGGNPDGDVTIVEFLDYRCGYCKRAHTEVAELLATDGNIRIIVKEYPILGEDSLMASRAAISTLQNLGSEAYKLMNDQLMLHNGPISPDAIRFLAKKVGLDADKIIDNMGQDSVTNHIALTRKLGQTLDVSGTPTFILNDQIVRGYIPLDAMQEMVAELRK